MVKMVYKGLKHHAIEAKAVQFLSTAAVCGEWKLACTALPMEDSVDSGPFHHLILKTRTLVSDFQGN